MSIALGERQITQSYLNEYSGNVLIGVCCTFIALETLFLALRFYARSLTQLGWQWEDLLLPVAWLTNIGLCSLCINAVPAAGVGRHLDAVLKADPYKLRAWGKTLVALELLYLTSNVLPKVSVLCLYLRIFTNRAARVACYIMIGIVVSIWFAYMVTSLTKCTPFVALWNKNIPGEHCVNIEAYYQSTSVPNIATDLVILLLPVPTVLSLHASKLRKFSLLLIFLAGGIGLIGSCIRLVFFFRSDAFTDNTWVSVPLMSWTCIESGMYLIAACCLALRPVFAKIPFTFIRSKFASGQDSRNSTRVKDPALTGSRSGFIQMQDFPDKSGIRRERRMDVMTTKSFTVDVQVDRDLEREAINERSHTQIG